MHWPLATSDGEMPLRSWRGKALSLGMSSGTRARGCPSTTDAARHTCLMRGPPALRNSWHKGEMTCGWEQMSVTHENTKQRSTRWLGGVVVQKMVKFNTELRFFFGYLFCAYLYLWGFCFNWDLSIKLSPLLPPLSFAHISRPGATGARQQLQVYEQKGHIS